MPDSGDPRGWVLEAVDLYELPLQRYARRLLGAFDLAVDPVQHAFVKLRGHPLVQPLIAADSAPSTTKVRHS